MDIINGIQPISNLKRKTAALLRQLAETGEPVVLTRNGEPTVVIQDAAAYQELMDLRDRLDTILRVKRGIADMKAGRTEPAAKVFARLEKKYGFEG